MKYLRKFASEADYNAAETLPTKNYVSLIGSGVVYDKGIAEGVYIQHIDGKLYTTDEWSAGGFIGDDANGVAVIDNNAQFVIAKSIISSGAAWSSDTSNLIEGVTTTSVAREALEDYVGEKNTQYISAVDASGAAYLCANYEFPNGSKGYLPALGELKIISQNKQSIFDAANKVGGPYIGNSTYWSSTQYRYDIAWNFSFLSISQNSSYKSTSYKVLALTSL